MPFTAGDDVGELTGTAGRFTGDFVAANVQVRPRGRMAGWRH
jgi:hypothetical protein